MKIKIPHKGVASYPLLAGSATLGVAYYPFMAPMPQWELPHTKVEQAQRTAGL